jgi:hypothetical protein
MQPRGVIIRMVMTPVAVEDKRSRQAGTRAVDSRFSLTLVHG